MAIANAVEAFADKLFKFFQEKANYQLDIRNFRQVVENLINKRISSESRYLCGQFYYLLYDSAENNLTIIYRTDNAINIVKLLARPLIINEPTQEQEVIVCCGCGTPTIAGGICTNPGCYQPLPQHPGN